MATLKKIDDTGLTLYAILRDASLQIWNTATTAMEAWNAANYTDYDIAATEQGSTGFYSITSPATLPVGVYSVDWRSRQTGTPLQSDPCVGLLSAYWDGTNWFHDWAIKLSQSAAPVTDSPEKNIKEAQADTNELQADWANGGRLDAILDGTAANQTTILNRLGAWTGTGVNTILGAFKAVLSKIAAMPSDIGGTGDPTTDSLEAIAEADAAAVLTSQQVRDAMKLAPTAGDPAAGSVDKHLDDVVTQATNAAADVATAKTQTTPTAIRADMGLATANLDAQLAAVPVGKTGYSLAVTGLDAISKAAPTGPPTSWTFSQWLVWLVRRSARANKTGTSLDVFDENGVKITTQTISEDLTTIVGEPTEPP